MDVKHKEIQSWLESVYGSATSVPAYEQTSTSIRLLHQLMTSAKQAERQARLLVQDYLQRADEYRAKAEQLSAVLQGIGLHKSKLSEEAQEALANITDAACAVNARTPSESAILLGYTRLEAEHDKATRKSDSNQQLQSQLMAFSQQLATKLEHLHSLEQQAAVTTALEQKELESNKKREMFHEKKLAEYQAELCSREAELQHRGYSSSLSHGTVLQQYQELQELQQQVAALQHQLSSYSLPPSVTAARLAVEEARQELEGLMSDMAGLQSRP